MDFSDQRPDPDKLLAALKAEEKKQTSANLRVFLGMSPGVGKTYAMLQAAQSRLKEGVDVVVGIVETHGRSETALLAEKLPSVPRRKLAYRGVELEEMDLDQVLKRKPKLVLVDELAHTNIPGSRHPKRYQDVLEMLAAGIDVYTTVNVQHLESRKDIVEQITGVPVKESVPDSILEQASQIELIDITPAELLKRLKEGKVYLGDRAERAAQAFFKADNLTALREIALRVTAERVDQELQQYRETSQGTGPWQTNERLMVAISYSPHSEKLIRATRRLAYNLDAPWIAVYIDTGIKLNTKDQAQLSKNITLARELNAEVITSTDIDITNALRRIARQKNVTQIVVGRPQRRWFLDFITGGSLLELLVEKNSDIDIHVIRHDGSGIRRISGLPKLQFSTGFYPYWFAFWGMAGIALFSAFAEPFIGYRAVGYAFLLGVLVVGLFSTIGPTIFSATLSAVLWNFLFIPPRFNFSIQEPSDVILCLAYFIVAIILGYLTNRIRTHEKILREREDRSNALYEISQDIASSPSKDEFLEKVAVRVENILPGDCWIIVRSRDGKLKLDEQKKYSPHINEKDRAVATWAFESGKPAGWSTDTLSNSKSLYIPLKTPNESVGVLVFHPTTKGRLNLEQENLLYTIARQLAVSLERHFFEKRLHESQRLEESEKLHQTLLNSISHEMRTPLTAIIGIANALHDIKNNQVKESVESLSEQLLEASDRLNRVIENLLDMTRLNSGVLALKLEWHDLHDLVGVTLKKLEKILSHHFVQTDIPADLPLIKVDFRFLEHALSNLLLNAATYSSPQTKIKISADIFDSFIRIFVDDEGPGIPDELHAKVFEKFFRVPGTPVGGTGLGLSIVKSITEAHGGKVMVLNKKEGGAQFIIALPYQKPPSIPE
ncbi:MAG: ATP-binding protein, partial [Bdellovibrio sp.]